MRWHVQNRRAVGKHMRWVRIIYTYNSIADYIKYPVPAANTRHRAILSDQPRAEHFFFTLPTETDLKK